MRNAIKLVTVMNNGAVWTPAQLTGLQAWYDASLPVYTDTGKTTLATANNALVAVIPDYSGNGRDLIRVTSDSWRPVLRTNVRKAQTARALRFVANSHAMITTETWQSFPSKRGSLYVVAYSSNKQSLAINVGNSTNIWMYFDPTAAKAKFYDTTNRAAASADPLIDDLTVHSAIRTGNTTVAYYRDSVSIGNITIGDNQPDAGPLKLSNPATNGITADVCEIILLDHASDAAEQAQIESYLLAKWKNPTRTPAWTKAGTVLSATEASEDSNAYEPTVLYEGDPQILTEETNVFKMWYSGEWETPAIFYAESVDGLTWTKYNSATPVIANANRGCIVKVGAVYWMYCKVNSSIALYTSNDGITWALDTAACLSVGAGAAWDSERVDNCHVWQEGENDWRMLYDGKSAAAAYYSLGYATSTGGKVWTKHASNPVALTSGPCLRKVGSTFWLWSHTSPEKDATLPTDLYRHYSTDCVNWVQSPSGLMALSRTTTDEGAGYGGLGQLADPWIMEVGGACYLFHSASSNGGSKTAGQHVKLATFAGTLAQLVALQEGS